MSSRPREPEVIDVGPRKRRRLKNWLIVAAVVLLLSFSRIVSVYISALGFGSLGYSSVYWYIFKMKLALFFGSAVLTAALLSATFLLFPETVRSLSLREANDHSQQPAIPVFTRKNHQTAWLDNLSAVWTDLRFPVERPLATVRALLASAGHKHF